MINMYHSIYCFLNQNLLWIKGTQNNWHVFLCNCAKNCYGTAKGNHSTTNLHNTLKTWKLSFEIFFSVVVLIGFPVFLLQLTFVCTFSLLICTTQFGLSIWSNEHSRFLQWNILLISNTKHTCCWIHIKLYVWAQLTMT